MKDDPQLIEYRKFLESKIELAPERIERGFAIQENNLKPHQVDSAHWLLRRQKALLAASFGLGKTRVQCAVADALVKAFNRPFLVVCPLAVKHQFQEEDGPVFGQDWRYVRADEEVEAAIADGAKFLITNYERVRDGGIDPRKHDLCGSSLDEGSVMRSLGSKTHGVFKRAFESIEYLFVATATPSPNSFRELIYYADALGIMDKGQALTRFFKRNPDKAGDLTLMPQHEEAFWLWVSTWALFLNKPSDLGHNDCGYELPGLNVHWHMVETDHTRASQRVEKNGQVRLLVNTARGISEAAEERHATVDVRLAKAIEIYNSAPEKHWLLWHYWEDERRAIQKALPQFKVVYGSQKLEEREDIILGFSRGTVKDLATKLEIAGSGCNFQKFCHSNIFLDVDAKFEDIIQTIHRTYRFLQNEIVDVHFIYSEANSRTVEIMKAKWEQHNILTEKMSEIMRKYGLSQAAIADDLKRKIGVDVHEVKGSRFTAIHGDTTQETRKLPDNSVGMVCTSIPFGNHYEYTTNVEDFGYNRTDGDFFKQMDFLVPELYRVLKPGRVAAIHVKDRILYSHQTPSGFEEVEEFSDDTVKAFKKHGFLYKGRRTVVTDVVRENNSTYRLTYGEMIKDATKMGSGLPEYVLLFRKPPSSNAQQYADEPVTKERANYSLARWQLTADNFQRSNGIIPALPEQWKDLEAAAVMNLHSIAQLTQVYDHDRHVAIGEALSSIDALPKTYSLLAPKATTSDDDMVWDNVRFMGNLNASQFRKNAANHICPLPFDLVERLILLYSNENDLVFDPFGGLFTVPYCAIKLNRYGMAVELNPDYFAAGVRYCQTMEIEKETPSLFDEPKTTEAEGEFI